MGPCRFYKRDKTAFNTYEEDNLDSDKDQEADGKEEAPPPPPPETKKQCDPVSEEIKGALRYINPNYQGEEIDKILKYALKSENIRRIIFNCARQYGYAAKSW